MVGMNDILLGLNGEHEWCFTLSKWWAVNTVQYLYTVVRAPKECLWWRWCCCGCYDVAATSTMGVDHDAVGEVAVLILLFMLQCVPELLRPLCLECCCFKISPLWVLNCKQSAAAAHLLSRENSDGGCILDNTHLWLKLNFHDTAREDFIFHTFVD